MKFGSREDAGVGEDDCGLHHTTSSAAEMWKSASKSHLFLWPLVRWSVTLIWRERSKYNEIITKASLARKQDATCPLAKLSNRAG